MSAIVMLVTMIHTQVLYIFKKKVEFMNHAQCPHISFESMFVKIWRSRYVVLMQRYTVVAPLSIWIGTPGISDGNMTIDSTTSLITPLNWVGLCSYSQAAPFAMAGEHWASPMRRSLPFGRVSGVFTCLKRSSSFGGRSVIMWCPLANGQINVAARQAAHCALYLLSL